MTAKSRTDLQTQFNADLADNTTGDISPADVRTAFTDVKDSALFPEDVVGQAEAEAGTATTARPWTAQRAFQSIAAWWAASAAKTKLDGIATGANLYVHPNHSGDVTSVADGAQTIANDAVSNAKLANMATATVKGRTTAGTGDPEDLTATQVRTLINVADGANNYSHPNHTGDVTSTGDGATVIANDAVTNAKLANMATATIKGRVTAATGDPEDLTAAQARTLLNVADGAQANVYASTAEVRTGTEAAKALAPANFAAGALVTVTYGATVALDFATFINAQITLTGGLTLNAPTNQVVGKSGIIRLVQDGTGGHALAAVNSAFKFPGGTLPVLTAAANAVDEIVYTILASGDISCGFRADVKAT